MNNATKVIRIMQVNKGNSSFNNIIDQIQELIDRHKPNVVVVNELNMTKDDVTSYYQFPNFTLVTDVLNITDSCSCTSILIHRYLHFK